MSVTLNYTTRVLVSQTVGEVQQLLGAPGASAILIAYEDRSPVGVSFTLAGPGGASHAFTLPVAVDAVYRLLNSAEAEEDIRRRLRKAPGPLQTREHAARVAWRTAKDWLEAQLALVQARMVTLEQVMLPYLHVDGQVTLYEAWSQNEQRAIEQAGGSR